MESKPEKVNLFTRLIKGGHVPDILDCIANLSSDEVFTPPELVDKMLDLFPEDIWSNPDLKWLDPACKTGIFLRQIAKRLMVGLRDVYPDEAERREHIFHSMLYGIALTDLTALMSRRSLYTSKNANGEKSIARFETAEGNISYDNRPHTYQNGTCIYCGNKEGSELDRDESRERHAYNFIHLKPEELRNMKFDVIVGNPPYQLNSAGFGAQATPIYQYFVQQAKRLNPHYMSFIIPSRWFAGGMGLNQFRDEMLNDRHMKKLVDYPNASDCFPGVEIKGGVSYFIRDNEYLGDCEISTIIGNEEHSSMVRPLNEYDTFIRWNGAVPILKKIQSKNEAVLSEQVLGMNPFNLATNFKDYDNINNPDKICLYLRGSEKGYIQRTRVQSGKELIDKYKVLLAAAAEGSGNIPNSVIGKPFVVAPPSASTMTYLVVGAYDDEEKARNLEKYLRTRFARFLIFLKKTTHHLSKDKFSFIPLLPMDQEWTDDKLFERYDITPDEQEYIKSMIKEM